MIKLEKEEQEKIYVHYRRSEKEGKFGEYGVSPPITQA